MNNTQYNLLMASITILRQIISIENENFKTSAELITNNENNQQVQKALKILEDLSLKV